MQICGSYVAIITWRVLYKLGLSNVMKTLIIWESWNYSRRYGWGISCTRFRWSISWSMAVRNCASVMRSISGFFCLQIMVTDSHYSVPTGWQINFHSHLQIVLGFPLVQQIGSSIAELTLFSTYFLSLPWDKADYSLGCASSQHRRSLVLRNIVDHNFHTGEVVFPWLKDQLR